MKITCQHEGCEVVFKTKKQLTYHHYKMSTECHNDTIYLLKTISSAKQIFKNIKKEKSNEKNDLERFSLLYKQAMDNISLDEHINAIVGFDFDD